MHTAAPPPSGAGSRTPIDVAVGVLVGLHHCSPEEAFTDLAAAVHDTGIGLGTLASALVKLASGSAEPFTHRDVVTHRWGALVAAA
jgi:hypothetical protein